MSSVMRRRLRRIGVSLSRSWLAISDGVRLELDSIHVVEEEGEPGGVLDMSESLKR